MKIDELLGRNSVKYVELPKKVNDKRKANNIYVCNRLNILEE